MTTPAPARPREFSIEVPDHWVRLDLSDSTLARARTDVLRSTRTPAERLQAEDLFKQARALVRSARRRGAVYGAGTATLYDDGLFMGNLMVFAVHLPEGETLEPSSIARTGGEGAETHPRTVTTVDLPHVGPAVRVVGTEKVWVTKQDRADMLGHHTLVPVPGSERDHFLISAASPNLTWADVVYELFDAIASTFRFVVLPPAGGGPS